MFTEMEIVVLRSVIQNKITETFKLMLEPCDEHLMDDIHYYEGIIEKLDKLEVCHD